MRVSTDLRFSELLEESVKKDFNENREDIR